MSNMNSLNSYQSIVLNTILKNPVVLDVETTTAAKGNPYNTTNKLVTIQLKQGDSPPIILTKENFSDAVDIINTASIIIGFNLKFDLAWIKKVLGVVPECVWDCQLAEFIFSRQTWKYPDLETTCQKYEVGHKLDIVKTEFWDKGIDTDQIPFEILAEYGAQDVNVTWEVFKKQLEIFKTEKQHQFRLFRVHCNDLLVLLEMAANGIVYDEQASLAKSQDLNKAIKLLDEKIYAFTNGVPINLDSRDHISCLLYGGVIKEEVRVPVGVYNSGAKIGQVRNKVIINEYKLPRIVEPLKGSELKKEGYFSTEEDTLLSLKPNASTKKLIKWLLERSKIIKLQSTYLEGLPKTIKDMSWPPNMLHSNLNQCVATTGRLSSTKPNQQNLPKEAKQYCVSRY